MAQETPDLHDPAFVAALFDRCAGNYRWWSAIASFGLIHRWRRQCIALVPPPLTTTPVIVDLMAGTGELWPHILRRFPDAQTITAIDISHQMHLHALNHLHKDRRDRISHLEANALKTDLPDNVADCVVSSFGLKTFSPAQHVLLAKQVARLLKPGGTFCLIEASNPRGWFLYPLYRLYLSGVLPQIERWFLRGAEDFAMFAQYTKSFENCAGFAEALRAQGLEVAQANHIFGAATSVQGRKPDQ